MDSILYLLAILVCIISMIIQFWLKSTVKKWSKVDSGTEYDANAAVAQMFRDNDILDVKIAHQDGELTDCYSPKERTIFLSNTSYNKNSVAAIAVAAHECGHAIQDSKQTAIYQLRQALTMPASFCSRFGMILAIGGFLLGSAAQSGSNLWFQVAKIGVVMYFVVFLFYLAMVPVEVDASRRGLEAIKKNGFISADKIKGARKVLTAAGSTYVISMTSAFITFLRIFMLVNRGRSRRR